MKNYYLKHILLCLCLFIGAKAYASYTDPTVLDAYIDGISYKLWYSGYNQAAVFRGNNSKIVTIPASVTYKNRTYTVTTISEYAFSGCNGITSISIPNSVISIAYNAFEGCYFVSGMFVNNTLLSSESNWGATFCDEETSDGLLIKGNAVVRCRPWATSVTIPDGVTCIADGAFQSCINLTSVVIPEGVTNIGSSAFNGCRALTSISIPESVTDICDYAFYECSSLTSIIIPESVTSLGNSAFTGCSSLTSATIGNSVTNIGNDTFSQCSSLASVSIGNSVTTIGQDAFNGCTNLSSVNIPNSVTTIGRNAFYNCKGLTSASIGNSVKSIGIGAFSGCSSLTSVTIGNSVTYIGEKAFYSCTSLKSIAIPNGVEAIGEYAFSVCHSLKSVVIPSSVTTIGSRAFHDCGLSKARVESMSPLSIFEDCFSNRGSITLYVPYGSKSAYEAASYWREFSEIIESESTDDGLIFTIDKENMEAEVVALLNSTDKIVIPASIEFAGETYSVTSIGNNAFKNCSNLSSITIPPTLKRVKTGAFKNCTSLSKVIVTDIAAWCGIIYDGDDVSNGDFPLGCARHLYSDENTEITELVVPEDVTRIEARAFRDAEYVTSITLSSNLTYIGQEAFRGTRFLSTINIPASVTSIEKWAFLDCSGLKDVYCYAENVPSTASDAFDGVNASLVTLHVPATAVDSYKDATPWSNFSRIVGIGEEVTPEIVEIATAEELANFATRVNAGETSLGAILTADIDLTAYTEFRINSYKGEFDGAGHSIKLATNYSFDECALFGYLCGYVHDLTTTGIITTSRKFAGGIAAQTEKATIERCQSRVNIISSVNGDGTHGGIVGVSHHGTIIRDCLVSGSISGSQTSCCGGVSGWADGITFISNCLITSDFSVSTANSDLLSRNSSNVRSSNNYFQGDWGAANDCGNVTLLTENQVKSGEACILLNDGRTDDEAVWYQTLGEDVSPVPDDSHNPVWFIEDFYTNRIMYSITFDTNGGSQIESITQRYGTTITPPENPTKEGHTFIGWEPAIPETMPATDLTVTAQWQINSYTLVYMVDGEEYKTSTVAYGTALTPEVAPTKEGHTFSGWSGLPETMPAHDVTVTGSFTVNNYTITYMVDGVVYMTSTVPYGTELVPEPALQKEGYTFTGWSEIPKTMPAHDVVVTGAFYIYGDVNIDDEVDLLDVVDIARFVVGTPAETFMVNLADLNYDKTVNVTDAVVLVNVVAGDQSFVKEMKMNTTNGHYDYASCGLELLGSRNNMLSFCLNGEVDFTAFQFTVDVPEDINITNLHLNGMRKDGHQLLYNKVEDGTYRVVALSLTNSMFKGSDGELLSISFDGLTPDEICIHDIHFVTTKGTEVTFEDLCLSGTATGIEDLMSNIDSDDKIYDIQGRRRQALQHGINIVNGKKVIIKK